MTATPRLAVRDVAKTFTMHLRDGIRLRVLDGVSFSVGRGECVVLGGPSGAGKSSILKIVYGNYAADSGAIEVDGDAGRIDLATASPRAVLAARHATIGYVSQFLRVVPRVSAREIVAEPLVVRGVARAEAIGRAETMLARLNLPRRLWDLPPATFSGGEQQRINVARGFIARYPLLLVDEPTASLDAENRAVVVALIREAKEEGGSFLGIFHDEAVRDAVADRVVDVTRFAPEAA
ncbi:MAG: phosphonate C-P lyase system protein PhnL [Rhizobiales bacterium]|nr:phosphonate C-P lyase system protein PhnL [Hyphomicrobiales bacterium]